MSSVRSGSPVTRWALYLLAGVGGGLAVGFLVGLARPRSWPDPASTG